MKNKFCFLWDKGFSILVTSLFVLHLVMLPRYNDIAKTWFALLILIALIYLIFNLNQIKHTTSLERTFLAAVVFNFAWIAFTYYVNGEPGRGASFVWDRHFYFLFLIPLFFMFREIEISDKVIVSTLLLSVLVSFSDILIDVALGADYRMQGMNMNAFGPLQVCLSGILFFYFLQRPEWISRWLIFAGFALGLVTVVLSKSRNTWVTLIVICIFFVFYLARAQPVWRRIGMAAGILLLFCSSYFLPIVEKRVDFAIEDLSTYFGEEYDRDDYVLRSIGERIELWRTGWKVFLDNPLLGVGAGGFKNAAKANLDRYQFKPRILRNKYLHNQYVSALATRGLPGLILFLIVMGMPMYIALANSSATRAHTTVTLSIILICLTYLVSCLGEDHFEVKSATMFVPVMLALLLARLSHNRSDQKTKKDE